jgi:hypothetical protein
MNHTIHSTPLLLPCDLTNWSHIQNKQFDEWSHEKWTIYKQLQLCLPRLKNNLSVDTNTNCTPSIQSYTPIRALPCSLLMWYLPKSHTIPDAVFLNCTWCLMQPFTYMVHLFTYISLFCDSTPSFPLLYNKGTVNIILILLVVANTFPLLCNKDNLILSLQFTLSLV